MCHELTSDIYVSRTHLGHICVTNSQRTYMCHELTSYAYRLYASTEERLISELRHPMCTIGNVDSQKSRFPQSRGIQSRYLFCKRVNRLLQIIGLFYRISSLLYGSFAKETYNFQDPTNRSHPIVESRMFHQEYGGI